MNKIDKLKSISFPSNENWLEIAKDLDDNERWIETSTRIAVSVLSLLKEKNMSKKDLAEKMGVKPQYVSRIVKGSENLTLETIARLEEALDTKLVKVIDTSHLFVYGKKKFDRNSFKKIFGSYGTTITA